MKNRNEADHAIATLAHHKEAIDGLLAKLQAHSDDFLGVAPDSVEWGHVGDAYRLRAKLEEALALAQGKGA